jgi:hypothetical protein
MMKTKLIALLAALVLALGLGVSNALALSINMRPAAGQTVPGTVTQTDASVVTPDANGNFAITQVLTIGDLLNQGWVFSAPGSSTNILGNVVAGTVNVDLSKGCTATETLTGAITQTFSNPLYCKGQLVCIDTTMDVTGNRAVTWSGFTGITPPQPAQGSNAVDSICFSDDGTHLLYPAGGGNPTVSTLQMIGSSSGTATITPPAAAGSPTLTLPTATGTFVTNNSTGVYVSMLSGEANAVVSNSVANVFPAFGSGVAVATTSEGTVDSAMPIAGTLSNLECYLTNAAGTKTVAGGTSYVVALRQNLGTSALTCSITTAITNCTDTNQAHNVTVSIGDQIDFIDTPSGTPTALIPHCAARFVF